MGAHRHDRTGSRAARRIGAASLAALALVACTGDGEPDPSPTAANSPAVSTGPGGVTRREVARVTADVDEYVYEGVTAASPPPVCVQYELTGGRRGIARYQVEVLLESNGGPAFTGPAGATVYYKVRIEAGGVAHDGRITFQKPREADGTIVTDADDLSRHGTLRFQPELYYGVQEVPPAMTRCVVEARAESDFAFEQFGGYPLRNPDLDPVVLDVSGNEVEAE